MSIDKIQHETNFGKINHISLNGYSINPKRTANHILSVLDGLSGYPDKWFCDHNEKVTDPSISLGEVLGGPEKIPMSVGKESIIHAGGLGKVLYGPIVFIGDHTETLIIDYDIVYANRNRLNIDVTKAEKFDDNKTVVNYGFVVFETGYMVIRFVDEDTLDSDKLCHVFLDIITTSEIDIDLIADHLRAPSIMYDGLGVFDINYNKTTTNINKNVLSLISFSKKIYKNEEDAEAPEIPWNYQITCINCGKRALYWDIEASKSVPVCEEHFDEMKMVYKPIKYYTDPLLRYKD